MFEVRGKFKNAGTWTPFKKIVEAHNEKFAVEKTYSLLGSNHKVRRNLIKIESVRKVE
jgi:large subunit ribosomal protein LX